MTDVRAPTSTTRGRFLGDRSDSLWSWTPYNAVPSRCDFANQDTMRRAFIPTIGVGPSDYRECFRHWPEFLALFLPLIFRINLAFLLRMRDRPNITSGSKSSVSRVINNNRLCQRRRARARVKGNRVHKLSSQCRGADASRKSKPACRGAAAVSRRSVLWHYRPQYRAGLLCLGPSNLHLQRGRNSGPGALSGGCCLCSGSTGSSSPADARKSIRSPL